MSEIASGVCLLVLTAGFCTVLFSGWALHCNNVTYRQRQKIIAFASGRRKMQDGFERVEYSDHMRALMFFRDPRDLYPDDLRGAF